MRVKICARKRTKPSSHSPLLLDLDLHQCKQCGAIYRAKVKHVFSWERQFMVDKCDVCRDFGYGIRPTLQNIPNNHQVKN
jgi:7,8-dihydro-6-hydroxymethylpterin-pyrophosphokinase